MPPRPLRHFGVCASEVSFGKLEIEHRLALGLVLGIDDLPGLFLGGLPQSGAFSRLGVYAIEDSIAASAAEETVACFHAIDAIATVNEPTSGALGSTGRVSPCS